MGNEGVLGFGGGVWSNFRRKCHVVKNLVASNVDI